MTPDETHLTDPEKELLAKAQAATPGPWMRCLATDDVRSSDGNSLFYAEDHHGNSVDVTVSKTDNADFIAAANPAAIIALLASLAEARGALDEMLEATKRCGVGCTHINVMDACARAEKALAAQAPAADLPRDEVLRRAAANTLRTGQEVIGEDPAAGEGDVTP